MEGSLAHHERGFCSEDCLEIWNEWMLRERSFAIPGIGDLLSNGMELTLERGLLYITVVLGCLIRVAVVEDPCTFLMSASFEWTCPDHSFFLDEVAKGFREIDGFTLADDEIYLDDDENIGFRRIELGKTGSDLTKVCLELIMEVLATRRRFDRECEKWAKKHAVELRQAGRQWVASTKVRTLNGEPIERAYDCFIRWLDSLSEVEEHLA